MPRQLLIVITLLSILGLGYMVAARSSSAATITVGPGQSIQAATITVAPGQSIQTAINAALSGDTVHVQAGVHAEQVSITKPLTLEGDAGAVIDGSCSREFGVFIGTPGVSGVVVRGFEIRNTRGSGVRIEHDDDLPMSSAPRNITVDESYIHDFWCNQSGDPFGVAGVSSWYGGPNITITDNTIKYRGALSDTASGQRSDADGIFFGSTNSRPSGGGHYVARNRIVGGWDGLGGGDEAEVAGTLHKNSTVENNVIMTCDDDGIQAEGGGQNVRIRNNTISGCLIGIAIASPQTGPTYVEGNVISGLFNACYKVGNGPGTGVTYLTGNRCTGPKGMQQTDPNHVSLVLRQNCWNQGGYIFELPYGPTSGLDFDEDVMYSTGTPFKWNGGVTYGSLAAFQAATGDEVNGTWSQTCPSGSPTSTPTPTAVSTSTPTPTLTPTATVPAASPTATSIATSTATAAPSTPTSTPTAVPPTATPTSTPSATATSSPSVPPNPTATPAPDRRCRIQDRQGGSWVWVVGEWRQQPDGSWACIVLVRPY